MFWVVSDYSKSKPNANQNKEKIITLPVIKQFVPCEILSLRLSGRQTVFTLLLGVIGLASCNNATSFVSVLLLYPL